jgi:hypothetical protein
MLASRLEQAKESFPQLSKIGPDRSVDYVGECDLEALILETEKIPGSEAEFRSTMGKLHGAAATAFAAGLKLSCQACDEPTTK